METQGVRAASPGEPGGEVFNPPSVDFAKRAARRLQKAYYTVAGDFLKLSAAHEAIARAYGHPSWFALARCVDRDGYRASPLDAALTASQLDARRVQQRDALQACFDLYRNDCMLVALEARLSSASVRVSAGDPSPVAIKDDLPLAEPRPGLTEILLTACPFSILGLNTPLPGWSEYVVVAAPCDNSALWVRFCHVSAVAEEAQLLVRAVATLSRGALATAYVPSSVLSEAPALVAALATIGVTATGGRMAIMAARLRDRLTKMAIHVAMDLRDDEDGPSIGELVTAMHVADGLVEIPDSKGRDPSHIDLRPVRFADALLRQIRRARWAKGEKGRPATRPAPKERRKVFGPEDDGRIRFGSGVRVLPKGTPVYRIRVELPLVDDYNPDARRVTISRVIDVPSRYDLWDLHVAIQDAMGWIDYHLHEFTFYASRTGRKALRFSSPNDDDPSEPTSVNERLSDHIASMVDWPARYLYDFGDHWEHLLTLLGTSPADGGGYPRCIAGDRACPPEDCGSELGYFRVLDVLAGGAAARRHPEVSRKEMREWLEGHVNVTWPYRPEYFDPGEVTFDDPQERWDYAYGDVQRYD